MTDILTVEGLRVVFPARRRRSEPFVAVDDVSFRIGPGETVALVGESGSGKTTIGKAILGLTEVTGGQILIEGAPVDRRRSSDRRRLARKVQAIFQDPYGSLNPSLRVGTTLTEPLRVQSRMSSDDAERAVDDLLHHVNLPTDAARRFPAHFSGGQRQRVAVARALAVRPQLIVCDEPTSALDVSTQRRVIELLQQLQTETGVSYLFITHDLAVVREFADRVLVLQQGRIVEEGSAQQVCEAPQHPYTRELIDAVPIPDPTRQRARRAERVGGR